MQGELRGLILMGGQVTVCLWTFNTMSHQPFMNLEMNKITYVKLAGNEFSGHKLLKVGWARSKTRADIGKCVCERITFVFCLINYLLLWEADAATVTRGDTRRAMSSKLARNPSIQTWCELAASVWAEQNKHVSVCLDFCFSTSWSIGDVFNKVLYLKLGKELIKIL